MSFYTIACGVTALVFGALFILLAIEDHRYANETVILDFGTGTGHEGTYFIGPRKNLVHEHNCDGTILPGTIVQTQNAG